MSLRSLAFLVIFLILFLFVVPVLGGPSVRRVPGDYPSIQAAINAANPGDTILVSSGLYNENVVLDKMVRLVGENVYSTIVDAGGRGPALVVTASNVFVSGFTLQNALVMNYGFFDGIDIGYSCSGNVVTQNIIQNCVHGVWVGSSDGNLIGNNIMSRNTYGLRLFASGKNTISNNLIANNKYCGIFIYGMEPYFSTHNIFSGNTILNSEHGLYIDSSGDSYNEFYRNNFVNNIVQVDVNGTNFWDNGAEGNYWSDYAGQDLNGDGIGDTLLPVHGVDYYPLVGPWSVNEFFDIILDGVTYRVETYSSNTVSSLSFSQSDKEISFEVTGPTGQCGFVNVTIPKQLLDAPGAPPFGSWLILLDGQDVTSMAKISWNSTHTFIYLPYLLTLHKIEVIGTTAVPEFGTTFALLSVIAGLTATAVISSKARRRLRSKTIEHK